MAFIPTAPTYTFGPKTVVNLVSPFLLFGSVSGTGTTQNTSLRKANGTAGYSVVGTTLTIHGIYVISSVAVSSAATIGYANNDVGFATNTAFTTAVYLGGSSGYQFIQTANAILSQGIPCDMTVPTGKFPFLQGQSGTANLAIIAVCTEV